MILVTGGTGLVGSHLLLELCKNNKAVRALYRPNSDRNLVKKIFEHYSPTFSALYDKIEWVEGDITDVLALEDALKGVDFVYHCAALVSFNKRDYARLMKVNAEGTANVVNACLDAGIKKLCYVSSTAAIGKGIQNSLLDEETKWENTPDISNYSISKHLAEREVWRGIEEGLQAVMVNPCVIVGPHNWNSGSNTIFKTIHDGLNFYTPGSNAIVDVRVVVNAMVQLMNSDIQSQRFLVISENLKFNELCEKIAVALNKRPPRKEVSFFTANMARRLEALRARFTGKDPRITKETLNAAFKNFSYSSEKLKKYLPDFNTGTADEAIANAIHFFDQNYTQKK